MLRAFLFYRLSIACPMPCPAALRKMCIFALLTRIGHETLGRLPACVMQHASGLAEGVAGYVGGVARSKMRTEADKMHKSIPLRKQETHSASLMTDLGL